jgi:hypothetical protein
MLYKSRNTSNSRLDESRGTGNSRDARNVGNTETLTAEGMSTAEGKSTAVGMTARLLGYRLDAISLGQKTLHFQGPASSLPLALVMNLHESKTIRTRPNKS